MDPTFKTKERREKEGQRKWEEVEKGGGREEEGRGKERMK